MTKLSHEKIAKFRAEAEAKERYIRSQINECLPPEIAEEVLYRLDENTRLRTKVANRRQALAALNKAHVVSMYFMETAQQRARKATNAMREIRELAEDAAHRG